MKPLLVLFGIFIPWAASAALKIATTTSDLAALASQVGGDQISVFSIAKGTQDPHQVEAKPSFMVRLRDVDLVLAQGFELESAWLQPLIQGARNPKLSSAQGVLELGVLLSPIEVAKQNVSRAEGDVHPGGNPHFQLDPIRLGSAAQIMATKFGELDPAHKDLFLKNAQAFQARMESQTKIWKERIKKAGTFEIVTYHKTFSYFCDRFGIKCELQLEPKPGIPPTASHLMSVIEQMKARKLQLVFIENLYEDTVGQKLSQSLPKVVVKRLAVSVGGEPTLASNEQLIENLVKAIEEGSK